MSSVPNSNPPGSRVYQWRDVLAVISLSTFQNQSIYLGVSPEMARIIGEFSRQSVLSLSASSNDASLYRSFPEQAAATLLDFMRKNCGREMVGAFIGWATSWWGQLDDNDGRHWITYEALFARWYGSLAHRQVDIVGFLQPFELLSEYEHSVLEETRRFKVLVKEQHTESGDQDILDLLNRRFDGEWDDEKPDLVPEIIEANRRRCLHIFWRTIRGLDSESLDNLFRSADVLQRNEFGHPPGFVLKSPLELEPSPYISIPVS